MIRQALCALVPGATALDPAGAQSTAQSVRIVWQIGEADRPNYDLSTVTDIAVDAQGNVYVGQSQETSVRVFDSSGRYLRRIGRYGNGPGELQSVSRLFVRGNELHVNDVSTQRLVVYNLNGTYREHWTMPRFPAYPGTIGGPRQKFANGAFEVTPMSGDSILPIVVMRPGSEQKRIIATVPVRHDGVLRIPGRITISIKPPMEWNSLYRSDPRGTTLTYLHRMVPARSDREAFFTIVRITPDGDTVFAKGFRYEPRPLSDAEWNELVDSTVAMATNVVRRARSEAARRNSRAFNITDDEVRNGMRARFAEPLPRPPVDDLVVADDGRTWLRQASGAAGGLRTWLVLDTAGVINSRVQVPASWRVAAIQQNHVYAIATGADDIPIVIKARVIPQQ